MTSSESSAARQKLKSHFCSHLQGINLELFLGLQGASCFSATITLSKIFLPREGFLTVKETNQNPNQNSETNHNNSIKCHAETLFAWQTHFCHAKTNHCTAMRILKGRKNPSFSLAALFQITQRLENPNHLSKAKYHFPFWKMLGIIYIPLHKSLCYFLFMFLSNCGFFKEKILIFCIYTLKCLLNFYYSCWFLLYYIIKRRLKFKIFFTFRF